MPQPANAGQTPVNVQTTHGVFVTILGQFIGVGILAIIADMGEGPGRVAVAIILGWALVFVMAHAQTLNGWIGKL